MLELIKPTHAPAHDESPKARVRRNISATAMAMALVIYQLLKEDSENFNVADLFNAGFTKDQVDCCMPTACGLAIRLRENEQHCVAH